MSARRALALVALLSLGTPAAAQSQGFNLRDLLTDFLREGITLAPPAGNFPSHSAHFIGGDSPQFQALQRFNSELASQLSSFPLASSAGGFSYRFDPALGVFTRSVDSFGPIYAERAETIGKGRFNLGVNFSHFTFDQVGDLALRDGDVRLVFTHEDTNRDEGNTNLFFEGDLITAQLFLKVETDITAFVLSYGVSERFDIGLAVPLVSVSLEAQTDAAIQRIATSVSAPTIHQFIGGGSEATIRQRGSASGVGDIVVRGKFQAVRGTAGGLALAADVRLPTGEERDLLGTGATQVKGLLIGSLRWGPFSPHVNAGYTWSSKGPDDTELPDEVSYTGGFDWSLHPRLTFVADVIGRTFLDSAIVRVEDTTFQANTTSPPAPPVIATAVFPRLVAGTEDVHSLLGSVGVKINPFGNFLVTINGLFKLNEEGLQDDFAPLIGIDYSF